MSSKNLLLVIAGILLFIGVAKPNLSLPFNNSSNDTIVVVSPPSSEELRLACKPVIESFKGSDSSSRVSDARRLSSLYMDLATLIELDGQDQVIKNTDEIRQANSLSGVMLRLNIKDKYSGLAENANAVIVSVIGDDSVLLDPELRTKAADAFRALSWACNEGSK